MLKRNTLFMASVLSLSLISINGCSNAPLLPGSFPSTSIFPAPYVKAFNKTDIVGNWHMIANGRIYNLNIGQVNGKTNIQSRLGRIDSVVWNTTTGKLSFQRYLSKSKIVNGEVIHYKIIQNYTGYLMEYTKENNSKKDYKWRISGTFMQVSPTIDKPISGWYATRPR